MHSTKLARVWVLFAQWGIAGVMAWSSLLPVHATEVFPYTATVQSDETFVHAGPGSDFYPTAKLESGAQVEVYRHDQDGWCAIRPLASSFSWVAAEHLEITDDPTLARVINLPVKTRVGSNLNDAFDVEYISLHKGEIVELRGSKVLALADSPPKRWFKIAPPSGEFRWVHAQHLRASNPSATDAPEPIESSTEELVPIDVPTYDLADVEDVTAQPKPAALDEKSLADAQPLRATSNAITAPAESKSMGFVEVTGVKQVNHEVIAVEAVNAELPSDTVTAPGSGTSAVNRAADENKSTESSLVTSTARGQLGPRDAMNLATEDSPSAAVRSPAGPTEIVTVETEDELGPAATIHVNPVTWEAVGTPTNPLAAPEPRGFVDKYNALNVMLSRAVLADIETWQLDKLLEQAKRLIQDADTHNELDLAKALSTRILEFQTLQDRRQQLALNHPTEAATASTGVPSAADTSKPLPLPEIRQVNHVQETAAPQPTSSIEMPRRVEPRRLPVGLNAESLKRKETIDNSMFDATGTLVMVRSRRTGIPQYALTNSSGEVIKFLSTRSPADLSNFVNKEVGVLGELGFIRSLNTGHVVANRVVLLQR